MAKNRVRCGSTVAAESAWPDTAETVTVGARMPLYLDWHDLGEGVTAEDVALAHGRDLQVQDRYGVRYLS
jgi:hypothetical protein